MGMNVTTIWNELRLILACICSLIGAVLPTIAGVPDTVWGIQRPEKLLIEGTMTVTTPSTGFEQSAGFTAILRGDTLMLTAKGPFGITVARVYANPDSFLVVNYFQQSAMYGSPNAKGIKDVLPMPVGLRDVLSIMSCVPPGERTLYTSADTLVDGAFEYRRSDTVQTEVVAVNAAERSLQSVTRYAPNGSPLLSVAYSDVRVIADSLKLPHAIKVVVNGGEHEVVFAYEEVSTNPPTLAESKLKVPRSFTRTAVR